MGTPNANVLGKFAADPSVTAIGDFDSGSEQYEFISESVRMVQAHVDSIGVRGDRSRVKDRVRISQEMVGGSIAMMLTPTEMRKWLPRILGGAEGGSGTSGSPWTYAVASTVPEFGLLFERGAKRFVYTGCKVARAVFTGGPGQLIGCTLDILGKEEIISATSFSGSIPAIASDQPWVFSDMAFALSADASADECFGFSLTIDNALERRFVNSVTATEIFETDRIVTLDMQLPYTADEIDLIDQAVTGAAGTLTFTNGALINGWALANLKAPNESPITPGRTGERTCSVRMSSYMSSSTREISATISTS